MGNRTGLRGARPRWALALAALCLVVPAPAAESGTGRPPAAALSLIRDMRLAYHARRALAADRELATLNLSVKVRDGVATLWGPVRSAEQGRRALRTVGQVDGILRVRSELYVTTPADPLEKFTLPPRADSPAYARSDTRREPGPPPAPPREPAPAPGTSAPRALPPLGDPPAPDRRPVMLLAPVAVPGRAGERVAARPVQGPATPPTTVEAAIEQLRRAEPRFWGVGAEVRGGTVVLKAESARGEDVMAFARALQRVKGVERVVVQAD
jgi:hypothetical protein